MDKARVRLYARLVLYVGLACFAVAFLQIARVWNGEGDAARQTALGAIFAAAGFVFASPAMFALVMAKE